MCDLSRTCLRTTFGSLLAVLAWLITGLRPIWQGAAPNGRQRIYFANHTSHGDFILLQSCFGFEERARTYAVAGKDYWHGGPIRRFLADVLLRTVLIERAPQQERSDPIAIMCDALDLGHSLILFPEGTRNMTNEPLLPFRTGLFKLAAARPDIELVPCWIENMARVMPKGTFFPVPLLCRVIFGEAMTLKTGEERQIFLDRARQALLDLNPKCKEYSS